MPPAGKEGKSHTCFTMKMPRFASFAACAAVLLATGTSTELWAGAIKYRNTAGDMCWPNGRIPYVFKDDITAEERLVFYRCARAWQRFADLKFVATTQFGIHQSPDGNFIEVQKNPIDNVNYAWIGRSGNIGLPEAKMQPLAIHNWTPGIVVHEIGHALGFIHEQSRSDRNTYVELFENNRLPFTGINYNIEQATIHTSYYDFGSIMHYDRGAFRIWGLSEDFLTMRAKPPFEEWTNWMGTNMIHFDGDRGTAIGDITAMLSAGDRETIQEAYGKSVLVKGKVKLANGYGLRGVKVELLPNGADEAHFTALLTETFERRVTTKEDGMFQFQGVPIGSYKLKVTRVGYTFQTDEIPIYTGSHDPAFVFNQDFLVTNAADTLPPEVNFYSPSGGDVQIHYKGTNTVAAGYLSQIHGQVYDPADPEAQDPQIYDVDKVEVAMDSNEQWWNWEEGRLDPPGTPFSFTAHIANPVVTGYAWVLGGTQKWPNSGAGLPNGAYHLQARASDLSGNYSEWGVKQANFTIDKDPPTVSVDWMQGGDPFLLVDMFDFEKGALGGTFVETGDPSPKAYFTIKGFNVGLVDVVYWQGAGWGPTESASGGHFPVKIEGGRWTPADPRQLPPRSALKERDAYDVTIVAEDRAGHLSTDSNAARGHFRLTPADTTVPTVAFVPARPDVVYTERSLPAITGTTADEQSYIQGMRLYLRRVVANSGGERKYWDGQMWRDSEAYVPVSLTPVPGNDTHYTWSAPDAGFTLPSGADLPDASYEMQITAYNRESPQSTAAVSENFKVAADPPRVAVTSVTHNGWAKAGWTLSGTVADTSNVTFSNSLNRVTLTINRDGQYWDGDSWENSPQTVYADILPDSTWIYPGTTAGAQMPTGDGSYSVSAHVRDNNGNVNEVITGGNQLIFTVDATPPQLTLASPAPGTIIDSSPLPAGWINGAAFDSSGPVTVTFRLKRLPSGVFTDVFWNGEIWRDELFGFGAGFDLAGTFPGDNGPTSWKFTGHQPRPGWDFNHCLINGSYEVVAVARDLAGNETTLTRPFHVDYHPQYIPPAFENMPMQPLQVPPLDAAALGSPDTTVFDPRIDGNDARTAFVSKLAVSGGGVLFAGASLNPNGFAVQRLGATPWRSERIAESTVVGSNVFYSEHWFGAGSSFSIPNWRYAARPSGLAALETDVAGNLYALFTQQVPSIIDIYPSQHALLVKFDASGSVTWIRTVPDVETHYSFIGSPTLKKMAWLPDGALGLLFSYTDTYSSGFGGGGGYSVETVMAVFEPDGDMRYLRPFGVTDTRSPDPTDFESSAVDFAADSAGNVFVASIETERFTGYGQPQAPDVRRIIRKLSPAGSTLTTHITDTCDFPELWDKLATDPAGNLYVAGRFMSGVRTPSDPARQEVLKFDNNLTLLWRAFGPPRIPAAGDAVIQLNADTDGAMTIDNSGMAAFFTSAGALKWARPIIQGGYNPYRFAFVDGSAIGILDTETPFITSHLVKISRAGDTQFDVLLTVNTDGVADLRADASHIYLLRQAPGSNQGYVERYNNIPDVTIPVTLDLGLPADQILVAGDALELKVINSGSLATGYQWRKYDNGTPVAIPGATSEKFTIGSLVLGDAGLYDCVVTNPNNNATSRTATLSVLAPAAFDVALDTPGRTWTTGGDAPFVGFMAQNPAGPAHDNTDAIMNRPLGVNQTSYIETTVTGPGSVTFWWKSANAEFQDNFTFSIDGDDLHSISGVQEWAPVTQSYGPGTHTLRWTYYKFSNSTATGDRVWLDDITFPTTVSLAEALDTTGLSWTTSAGGLAWTGVSTPSHDGVDSAASGTTGNNQQSFMETTVTGPGTLSFWWKVSSENGFDALKLTVDGAPYGSASGEVDWTEIVRPISAGTHVIRWSYEKDGFLAGGQDRAWVDQVAFTGGGSAPDIAVESPVNHALIDNAGLGVDFGTALAGGSTVRTFTIRNTGNAPLSNIVVSKSGGPSAALFTIGALSTADPILPGGTATFDVTFAPVVEGSRGAALHITSDDPDESPFDIGIYGTGGVPITSWRQTHFGTTANTGDAADDADADGDGVPNLLEFATQGTPGTSDKEPGELAPLDGSGSIYFTYTRNKQAMAEITFQVEWADDLSGPWSPSGVVENILSDNGLIQTVTATLPAGTEGHRFLRLRVSR